MQTLLFLVIIIIVAIVKITQLLSVVIKMFSQTIKLLFSLVRQYLVGIRNEILTSLEFCYTIFSKIRRLFSKRKRIRKLKNKTVFSPYLGIKVKYFVVGSLFSAFFIFIPTLIILLIENLPNPNVLTLQQSPQTTKIYDRNHVLLYEIYANQNRTIIPLAQVPKQLQEATIAIEDKNFYQNPGFDITAIIRAFIADFSGQDLQGGSTITQQLVKVTLLTPKISIIRKVEEIALAFWTEKIYTKQQILQMYFNQVPYGGTAWGAEAASEVYFGKPVTELDLAQSAFLAGIPRAPTLYSPYGGYPNLWKNREVEVLSRMQQLGYISKNQKQDAENEQLLFKSPQTPFIAPHFVMYIRDLLVSRYGVSAVEKGGLEVLTSLDTNIQKMAQQTVTDEVSKDASLNLHNGAAMVTNPQNGDILAMVGGKDYNSDDGGNFNVTTALRQPGSSIKIITYSAALSHGLTAASMIDDSPITFTDQWGNSYAPVNYDDRFHGTVTLRAALANSLNIPAVKTLNKIGIPAFVDLAKQMGITNLGDPSNYGLSITLGAADTTMVNMATAFGTLANQGERVDLNPILKITDGKGNVLEEKKSIPRVRVLDQGVAYILSDILADNNARSMEFGSNSPLYIPNHTVSVKTGTSDNKHDNWTDGYTKNYVVTVWVGNNDNSAMDPSLTSGITGAAPIWHEIINNLIKDTPDEKFAVPADIIQKQCFGRSEYFLRGTENTVNCGNPQPTFPFFYKIPHYFP